MATNFGSDTHCITDVERIDHIVTSPALVIGERIARRLQTPRGALGLIGDDPNGGLDLRQYMLAKMRPGDRQIAEAQVSSECLKDEEVGAARVSTNASGDSLVFTIDLDTAEGPFRLTSTVGALNIDFVFEFNT